MIAILAFVWLTPPDWLGDPTAARPGLLGLIARWRLTEFANVRSGLKYLDAFLDFEVRNAFMLVLRFAPSWRGFVDDRLGRLLLLRADRVEALPQRVHQVDDLRRRLDRRRDDLLAGDLRVDDLLQPFAVFVLVVGQIERRPRRSRSPAARASSPPA